MNVPSPSGQMRRRVYGSSVNRSLLIGLGATAALRSSSSRCCSSPARATTRSPTACASARSTSAVCNATRHVTSFVAGCPHRRRRPAAWPCSTAAATSSCGRPSRAPGSTSARRSTPRSTATRIPPSARGSTFSRSALNAFVARVGARVDRPARDADIAWRDGKLQRTHARSGVEMLRAQLAGALAKVLSNPAAPRSVRLPVRTAERAGPHAGRSRQALSDRDRGRPRRQAAAAVQVTYGSSTST